MQVFDDYLQQLGEDTAAYVRTVCQTIVLTVPKAVIHCQVSTSGHTHLEAPLDSARYPNTCKQGSPSTAGHVELSMACNLRRVSCCVQPGMLL